MKKNTKLNLLSLAGAILFVGLFAVPAADKITVWFVALKALNVAAFAGIARLFEKIDGEPAATK